MMNLSTDGVVVVGRNGRVVSERLSSAAYDGFCGDRAEFNQPMAAVSVGGRTVWIMKSRLEDGYDYSLYDPDTRDSVQLKGTWGTRKSSRALRKSSRMVN